MFQKWESDGFKVNVLYNTNRGWQLTLERWVDNNFERKFSISGASTLEDAVSRMSKKLIDYP